MLSVKYREEFSSLRIDRVALDVVYCKKSGKPRDKGMRCMKQDMLAVLDLGSTRNTDVARAIRALGVYSEICNYDITAEELRNMPNLKGIVAPTMWWMAKRFG